MTTEKTVNGADKSGASQGATATAGKDVRDGAEAQNGSLKDVTSSEELTARLSAMWRAESNPPGKETKAQPKEPKAEAGPEKTEGKPSRERKGESRNGKVLEHGVEEEPEREEEGQSTADHAESADQNKGEVSPEEHEPTGEAEPEGETEETEEEGEDTETGEDDGVKPGKDWPKSAVAAVAKFRGERRELKGTLEAANTRLTEAMARLESEELARPIRIPGDPLAFADTPEKLDQWAGVAERRLELIEGYLDDVLSAREMRELEAFAEANGAWNAEEKAFDKGAMKDLRKTLRTGLQTELPRRREFFQKERQISAAVEKDPVLGPIWKDKLSPEYKDAMAVLTTIPAVRQLPHYRAAAAIYALGLKEYGRALAALQAGDGKGGKRAMTNDQAVMTKGKEGSAGPGKTVVKPKNVVKGPGRTVLPRNPGAGEVDDARVKERMRSADATTEDAVDYTRRALAGKLR